MPDRIVVRKPPQRTEVLNRFFSDPWPNLVETPSLKDGDLLDRYEREKGYSLWRRAVDKVYVALPGKRSNDRRRRSVLQFLRKKIKREILTDGLSGFELTDQVFPPGYELHDPAFKCPDLAIELEEPFKVGPGVLFSAYGFPERLRTNLKKALSDVLGVEPKFQKWVDYFKQLHEGDFDFFFTSFGLADPDPEGVMSFYFEGELPVVQSGTGRENYVERLDEARKVSDRSERLKVFRGILRDAVCDGRILPLFHLSTIGVGKPPLDLSKIPVTDEAVTFSEIRFR